MKVAISRIVIALAVAWTSQIALADDLFSEVTITSVFGSMSLRMRMICHNPS